MRASAAVEGAAKSVASTGSHTTKTRTVAPLFSCSNCSVAEAPCKQYAQVGDSSTRKRMEDAESLNAPFRGARSLEEKLTRRGCPLGVELLPYKEYVAPSSARTITAEKTRLLFIIFPPGCRPRSWRSPVEKI